MAEILNTSQELLPYIGVAAGYSAGLLTEHIIQQRQAPERANASELFGEVNQHIAQEDSRLVLTGKKLMGPLALTGALVGGINGYAWQPEEKLPAQPAAIQFVVDRSGATGVKTNGLAPSQTIDKVLATFDGKSNFNIIAHVASSNEVNQTALNEVKNVQPFGDAPMRSAFKTANSSIQAASDSEKSADKNPAIVVLTNGNTVGKTKTAVTQATKSRSPVYIVNVNKDINPKAEKSLQAISKQTDAQYWDTSVIKVQTIPDKISDEVGPAPEQNGTAGSNFLKVLGLGGVVYFARRMKTRKDEPMQFKAMQSN